jgi:hypothetical protein
MFNEAGPIPNCTTASNFNALNISFVTAYAWATVRLGLPSGIGPVGIPIILRSFTILATDTTVDNPGLFIREHTNNILGNCCTGGLVVWKKSFIVLQICDIPIVVIINIY